jgi:hypothetical protein
MILGGSSRFCGGFELIDRPESCAGERVLKHLGRDNGVEALSLSSGGRGGGKVRGANVRLT